MVPQSIFPPSNPWKSASFQIFQNFFQEILKFSFILSFFLVLVIEGIFLISKDSQCHDTSLAGIRYKTGTLPNLEIRFAQK